MLTLASVAAAPLEQKTNGSGVQLLVRAGPQYAQLITRGRVINPDLCEERTETCSGTMLRIDHLKPTPHFKISSLNVPLP